MEVAVWGKLVLPSLFPLRRGGDLRFLRARRGHCRGCGPWPSESLLIQSWHSACSQDDTAFGLWSQRNCRPPSRGSVNAYLGIVHTQFRATCYAPSMTLLTFISINTNNWDKYWTFQRRELINWFTQQKKKWSLGDQLTHRCRHVLPDLGSTP